MKTRIRRIFAWIIDWWLTCIAAFVCCAILIAAMAIFGEGIAPIVAPLLIVCILGTFAAFVLRDLIFKGRSVGKRLFCLGVYDKNTLQEPRNEQKWLRNIFLFIYPIDGIVLLATGGSIGDMVAGTTVVNTEDIEAMRSGEKAPAPVNPRKNAITIVAIVLACIAVFFGIIFSALKAATHTEEYKVSYNYLITSEAYKALDAEPDEVKFNQYRVSYSNSSSKAEISFVVDGKRFTVVCHKEGGAWQVCEECTKFS